jgi:hypothetical protein
MAEAQSASPLVTLGWSVAFSAAVYLMRRIIFKSPMCITPLSPFAHRARGKGHMAQFSVEIIRLSGSLLVEV